MSVFLNTAISALDKPTSLIQFWVKDAFDVTGRTAMANKEGGKHEAREKFIEEAGTSIFWIGGIPALRWIAGKIAKIKGNIDPDIHFKRITSNGVQSYFAQELMNDGKKKFTAQDLQGIVLDGEKLTKIKAKLKNSQELYKKYHINVTAAAVLFNLFMLMVVLPKFNQNLSKKIISKEMNEEQENINAKNIQFLQQQHKKLPVSFGSSEALFDFKNLFNFTKAAEEAQLNVTSSMLLLDYGISGSRVSFIPRNNNERVEYAVKEGGIILFFYYAADWLKKGFEFVTNKLLKTPIDLDYKILTDKKFADKLKSSGKHELLEFVDGEADELNVIKFIDKELKNVSKDGIFNNFTLQMAQKSGLIDVEYDSTLNKWIRHSKKYIETDKVAELNKDLVKFYEQNMAKGKTIEEIISRTKKVKALSVFVNIAICCASLSYFLPKIQYMIREHRTKTSDAPGIKHYQDMAEKDLI